MGVTSALPGGIDGDPVSRGLIRTIFGEYTAASVAAHPLDADRLSLVRQADGDYAPAILVSGSAAARSSAGVQAALGTFALGG